MTLLHRLANSSAFCKFLLVACALTWGFSFFIMKDAVGQFPVFMLLAIRFVTSAIIMFVVFRRRILANLDRDTVVAGLLIGVFAWGGYVFQTFGLTLTTPGKNAFLTGCYCVLVPFCAWAMHLGRPDRHNMVAALICLLGLALVALDNGFPLNLGDMLTLVGAIFYAFQITAVHKWGQTSDVWAITFWQFLVTGLGSAACSLLFETPPPPSVWTPYNFFVLAFLAVICSFICLAATNHALTKVDPAPAALLSSLESPSGVAFSVAFAGEALTPRLLFGFALIFCAITFSQAGTQIVEALPGKGHRSRHR